MTAPQDERNKGYDQPYADFDSPLKRQLRQEYLARQAAEPG